MGDARLEEDRGLEAVREGGERERERELGREKREGEFEGGKKCAIIKNFFSRV